MGRMKRFLRIVAPQIMRFSLPGLGNVWQLSLKDSALISVTGLAELMRQSEVAAGSTHLYFVFYIAGGVLYLVLTTLSDRVFGVAERRVAKSFRGGLGRG
jgi:octopine/nopaline transport system permease protein